MKNKCNICGGEVSYQDGGVALMMAFCIKNTTNLINLSFCNECYNVLLEKPMHDLNTAGGLNINFQDEGD